jgi:SAM-dependent methyltransferase
MDPAAADLDDAFAASARDLYLHATCSEENDPVVAAEWMYRRRDVYRLFKRAINELPDGPLRICDAGFGDGFNIAYVVRRSLEDFKQDENRLTALRASEIVSLDVPSVWPERLRHALRMFGVDRYRHIDCDLTKRLPLENDSVDIMLCTEVVEHLEHPEMLLREVKRVIRPDGFLILTTPNEPSLPSRLKSWSRGRRVSVPRSRETHAVGGINVYGHISTKPTAKWESLLTESGFAIESFGSYRIIGNPADRDIRSDAFAPVVTRFLLAGVAALLPTRARRFIGVNVTLLARRVTGTARRSANSPVSRADQAADRRNRPASTDTAA